MQSARPFFNLSSMLYDLLVDKDYSKQVIYNYLLILLIIIIIL